MSGLPPTQPLNSRHPALQIGRSAKQKQSKPKCSFCKRGFQMWRVPQLQIKCTNCQNFVHLRCIKTEYDEERFVCDNCSPPPSTASSTPSTLQPNDNCSPPPSSHSTLQEYSLEERSDISPGQETVANSNDNTQVLSGGHWFKSLNNCNII